VLVGGVKKSSQFRLHAEQIEVIAGDIVAVDFAGGMIPTEADARQAVDRGHAAEDGIPPAEVFERGIGWAAAHPLFVKHLHNLLRIANRQRLKNHRIQHTEDDDIGSEAKRQGHDSGDGESG